MLVVQDLVGFQLDSNMEVAGGRVTRLSPGNGEKLSVTEITTDMQRRKLD